MPREYPRKARVSVELQRLVNELLYTEIKDPRLVGVTITEVDVAAGLSSARIYFAMLSPDGDPAGALAAFDKAAGFLRGRIGRTLRVRRVPELHFVHDETARRGAEITQLIEQARQRPGNDDPGDD